MPKRSVKRAKKSSSLSFLDLEASVDQDGDDRDSEMEEEEEDGFVVPDKHPARTSHFHPLLADATVEEEAARLEGVALAIEGRYAGVATTSTSLVQDSGLVDIVETATCYPSLHDPEIWKLSVDEGCEYEILMKCMEAASSGSPSSTVLSVFYREHQPGAVYIESRRSTVDARLSLGSFLKGIAPVSFLGSNKSRLTFVPLEDRVKLLMPSSQSRTCKPGAWVRLRRGGYYHNDLGFVTEVHDEVAVVIFIPRLSFSPASRGRPPQALFDPNVVKDIQGTRAVRHNRGLNMFRGKTFTPDGFEIHSFRTSDLDDDHVLPKETELVFFDESGNVDVQHAIQVIRSKVQFGVSEKVLVCSGALQGTSGHIVSIDNTEMAQIETSDDHLLVEVPQRYMRRAFSCGDYVTIINGEHQGREGFITEVRGQLVTLYMTVGELGPQTAVGEEFRIEQTRINWKKNVNNSDAEPGAVEERPLSGKARRRDPMHTGDPFRGMNVRVIKGNLKGHRATVIGSTPVLNEKFSVTLRIDTQAVKTTVELDNDDVTELVTGLSLLKAQWIPRGTLLPGLIVRPSTPTHSDSRETSLSLAWDPTSRLPSEPIAKLGEWLLDPRLDNKRLDVVIQGTKEGIYYRGGKYEGCRGVLVLNRPRKGLDCSVMVKLGIMATQVKFPLKYVLPETTTEREGAVKASDAQPVHTVLGQRVVVIGPDLSGNTSFIGCYGCVSSCQYPLQPHDALILLYHPVSQFAYFHKKNICRSHHESVLWDKTWIQ